MSSVINCTICLEHLASDTFGCLSPCGHYFHEQCYNQWMATCYNKPSYNNRQHQVKCPQCNVESKGFIRSFLDLDHLCWNDDVSISDDDCDDDDQSHACQEQQKEDEPEVPEVLKDDYVEKEEDVICIHDDDDDDLNTLLQMAAGDTVQASVSRRVTLDGTDNTDAESPTSSTRKRKRLETHSSTTTTTASSSSEQNNDELERIQKKYKYLKQKMTGMKKSLQHFQRENKEQHQLKAENTVLKDQLQSIEKQCQNQLYDNSKMKRELEQAKLDKTRLSNENSNLKTKLNLTRKLHQSELKQYQEKLQQAKGASMAEMKQITFRNHKLQQENTDLLQEWQEQNCTLQELQKECASMKKQLESNARKQFQSNIQQKQQRRPWSKSKMIQNVKEARREMQRMENLTKEEERRLEQKRQEQKMKLTMSRQSNRISKAAATKLSFLKTKVKPSVVGSGVATAGGMNRTTKSDSNNMNKVLPKPKTAIKSHFVKKASGKKDDLRNYFQK